jgi:hypothetical protein
MCVGSITIGSPSSGRVPVPRTELRVGCTPCASLVYDVCVEINNIPEDGILHSHRRENLKPYTFTYRFPNVTTGLQPITYTSALLASPLYAVV